MYRLGFGDTEILLPAPRSTSFVSWMPASRRFGRIVRRSCLSGVEFEKVPAGRSCCHHVARCERLQHRVGNQLRPICNPSPAGTIGESASARWRQRRARGYRRQSSRLPYGTGHIATGRLPWPLFRLPGWPSEGIGQGVHDRKSSIGLWPRPGPNHHFLGEEVRDSSIPTDPAPGAYTAVS